MANIVIKFVVLFFICIWMLLKVLATVLNIFWLSGHISGYILIFLEILSSYRTSSSMFNSSYLWAFEGMRLLVMVIMWGSMLIVLNLNMIIRYLKLIIIIFSLLIIVKMCFNEAFNMRWRIFVIFLREFLVNWIFSRFLTLSQK